MADNGDVLAALFARGPLSFAEMEPGLSAILSDPEHRDSANLRTLLAHYGFSRHVDRVAGFDNLADALRAAEERLERARAEG